MIGGVANMGKEKLKVKLVGTDGNAFAILKRVSVALKNSGRKDEAKKYLEEAMASDYDNLLQVTMKYVDVE